MALRASYYGLKKRILDKILGDYDAAGVMTNKELTEFALGLKDGLLNAIFLQKSYGGVNPINIDAIDNEKGYFLRISDGSGLSGTKPSGLGNSYILIGLSAIVNNLPSYGVQIAFGFGADIIAIRHAAYNASGGSWGAWKYLTAS